MYEPHVTLLATVVSPPRHIVTESGVPLLTMRLASTPRWYDKSRREWRDGETLFLNVTCWRALADNVAASVRTGMPVVVSGRLRVRAWNEQSGARRTAMEVEAFSVGPDLSRGVASFQRASARGPVATEPRGGTEDASAQGGGAAATSSVREFAHEWRSARSASPAAADEPDGGPAGQADPNAA